MGKAVSRLYTQFKPSHYGLSLVPDGDAMRFSGTVTVRGVKVGRPSERLTFHAKGLKVSTASIIRHDKKGDQEVVVNRINLQKSFDEVRLHADQQLYPGEYSVTMTFTGDIHEVMHGIYPCHYTVDGVAKKLIATQFESHHAREAFPCIDEPAAKATFDLTLTTPTGEAVVANTPIAEQHEANGKLVTTFETTPKMSTYLLAFVYGDLQYKEAETKDGVTVRVWATRAQNLAAFDFPLSVGVQAIEFFNEYYGVPYPLAKCDHVALPDFSSAAMENWGLITYREAYLLVDPETTPQSMKEAITTVICHELSHQWFGNLVTMAWWDDLWLNESFANVMEYVATDALFPEWQIWNTFISQEGLSSQRRDSIAGVQSVKTPVTHPDQIGSLFDPSIVYAKGGRLLNMLMHYIGTENFRKGLKLYFEKHAYGNTTGDDLWAALTTASGKPIADFMNPWLTRSGFPLIAVNQQDKAVEIAQSHFLINPKEADANRLWPVPLLASAEQLPALLEGRQIETSLPTADYVRLDSGAVGHYIVHYEQPKHAAAIAKLVETQQLTPAERLMLLSDSSLIARSGLASFGETLALLEHYRREANETVWGILSLILADARRFIDVDEQLEGAIKAFMRTFIQTQYERLGWDEIAHEPASDKKLRATIIGLGVYAHHEAILDRALQAFEEYKADASAVASELRDIVLGAAVREALPGAFEYLLKLEETTVNPDLKQELMGALSLTKTESEIARLLERITDLQKVRLHDVDTWLIYLLRNRYGRRQAWDWLRDHWVWIEKTFAGDKSYDTFPRYAASAFNTRQLYEEYKAFFEPKAADVALSRNITLGIEELASRVEWLERDLPAVADYFSQP